MKERQKERDEKEQQETAAEKSRPSSYGRSPWFRQQEEEQDEEDDAEEDDEDEVWEDCDDDEEDEEGQDDDDNVWEDCDDEDEEECDEPPRSSTIREEDEITALRNSIRSVGMGWSAEEKRVNGQASHGPASETSSAAVDPPVKHTDNSSAPNGTDSSAASDSPIAAVPVPVPDVSHTPVALPSSSTPVPDTSSSSSAPLSSLPLDPAVSTDSAIPSDTPLTAPTPTPAAATTSTHVAASPPLKVSRSLRARLLSVCSSIAYLSGDALGAVKCLRASVQENLTAGRTSLSVPYVVCVLCLYLYLYLYFSLVNGLFGRFLCMHGCYSGIRYKVYGHSSSRALSLPPLVVCSSLCLQSISCLHYLLQRMHCTVPYCLTLFHCTALHCRGSACRLRHQARNTASRHGSDGGGGQDTDQSSERESQQCYHIPPSS
jgi:hypothetical protein